MTDSVSTVSADTQSDTGTEPSDAGKAADAGGGADAGYDVDAGASSPENDYTRLYCVEYSTTGSASLKINIINYWEDCHGPFDAKFTDGNSTSLEITVTPQECAASGCFCPYDFSLDAGGLDLNVPVTLSIERFSCVTWNAESEETVTLHPEQSKSGIICQYFGDTGGRNGLCNDDGTCDDGLVCEGSETLRGFEEVCLVPCENRFDCPVPDAFTCEEGACHVIPNMTQSPR